jgi:S1-C subfamily serine protease
MQASRMAHWLKAGLKDRARLPIIGAVFFCWALQLSPPGSARNPSSGIDSQDGRSDSASSETRAAVLKAIYTVGLVLVRNSADPTGEGPRPRGSGVVVRKDGIVVTNFHVIAQDNSTALYDDLFFNVPDPGVSAQLADHRYRLKPVLIKREYDLALLRITSDSNGQPVPISEVLPAIELGDSRAIQLLDKLIIIGFPEEGGASVTVNEGIVEGKDIAGNWIKTSARLIHGNSGGAAVDKAGRLIGIPTRVLIDRTLIEKKPAANRENGAAYEAAAVGYLRPAQLVKSMLAKVETLAGRSSPAKPLVTGGSEKPPEHQAAPQPSSASALITVRGLVRGADDHHLIAGARIGLVPLGARDVTPANLLAWGGTNSEGQFELNKPAVPGRYTVKVRALGYQDFIGEVNVGSEPVIIELHSL